MVSHVGFSRLRKPSVMPVVLMAILKDSLVSHVPLKFDCLPSLKLTFSHLKMDGWNTSFVSFWR